MKVSTVVIGAAVIAGLALIATSAKGAINFVRDLVIKTGEPYGFSIKGGLFGNFECTLPVELINKTQNTANVSNIIVRAYLPDGTELVRSLVSGSYTIAALQTTTIPVLLQISIQNIVAMLPNIDPLQILQTSKIGISLDVKVFADVEGVTIQQDLRIEV